MALIQCDECGKTFSDKAAACPVCAAPTPAPTNDTLPRSKSLNDADAIPKPANDAPIHPQPQTDFAPPIPTSNEQAPDTGPRTVALLLGVLIGLTVVAVAAPLIGALLGALLVAFAASNVIRRHRGFLGRSARIGPDMYKTHVALSLLEGFVGMLAVVVAIGVFVSERKAKA